MTASSRCVLLRGSIKLLERRKTLRNVLPACRAVTCVNGCDVTKDVCALEPSDSVHVHEGIDVVSGAGLPDDNRSNKIERNLSKSGPFF